MSSLSGDDDTTSKVDSTSPTFDHDFSQMTIPQHLLKNEKATSLDTLEFAEALDEKVGIFTEKGSTPNPLLGSQISLKSVKVNACDIALAVEDPFAVPASEPTRNDDSENDHLMGTNGFLPEPNVDNKRETTKLTDTAVGATPGLKNGNVPKPSENIVQRDHSESFWREGTRPEKMIPVKEIVLDTTDDAVLSLSSSRHVPVTAETAVTAESSPSWQRGTALQAARATRNNGPSSSTSMAGNPESIGSIPVERPIDIHAITDNILAGSACYADNAVWSDSGRPPADLDRPTSSDNSVHAGKTQQTEQPFRRKRPRPESGNCPIRLRAYLKERHNAAPVMIFQLTDCPPDDHTLHTFDRQIIHIPWNSPGQQAMSETPCIRTMLHFCYALSAWLHNNSASIASMSSTRSTRHSNGPVAIVSCRNGKTRTAIATSCYLKYAGIVDNVQSGFCHFLERRCGREILASSPETIVSDLPASLHAFFRNFDTAVELGGYMNHKPLLLKAITVQGVPLEDQPCLDLWDSSGRHVYSTHPELWSDVLDSNATALPSGHNRNSRTSQWADEEGFFRVNQVVQGDFCLICRFGGVYANDITDASKVLFRYANSTAFMSGVSPYELKCHNVDVQRRYVQYFDDEDFLLTLFFEAHWNASDAHKEILNTVCDDDILPAVLTGADANELGWHIIAQHHTAKPQLNDLDKLATESLGELDGCPNHLLSLALQLANFDFTMAQTILLEGRLRSWWQVQLDDLSVLPKGDPFYSGPTILDGVEYMSHADAIEKIDVIMKHVSPSIFQSENTPSSEVPQRDSRTRNTSSITSRPSQAKSESFFISPIMRPNSGDIVSVLHASRVSTIFQNSDTSFIADHPIFPIMPRRRRRGNPGLSEHPDNTNDMELLLTLDHPGVYLKDLLDLKEALSIASNADKSIPHVSADMTDSTATISLPSVEKNMTKVAPSATNSSDVLIGTPHQNAHMDNNPLGEISLTAQNDVASKFADNVPIKDDPSYEKYLKMRKLGIPEGAIRNAMIKDGVDTKVLDVDPERSFISQSKTEPSTAHDIPIKDDPSYQKYFKMKKVGLPDGAIRNAMTKDGVDTKVWDLDPERSFISQTKTELSTAHDIPIKDDPSYQKYFKMKKVGLPDGAIRNAMIKDGVDTKVWDLDPERSLISQTKTEPSTAHDIPIKDDPSYQKYFKMKKMGLPDGAIRNAMIKDGVDATVWDLDPERSFISQTKTEPSTADDIPIKGDPSYQKYFKMKKMGLPDGAIRNAMIKDGVDAKLWDLDPERSFISQTKTEPSTADDIPIKDDPSYQKYFKMKKMGLPDGAIRNAMIKDGVDAKLWDLDPERSFISQTKTEPSTADDIPIKDDPSYQKYFKMKKMGLPDGAIRNAMIKDGLDASIFDLDHNRSLASQLLTNTNGSTLSLQEDPEWSKYFRMLRMGLPLGAVKNAATKDGKDSSILDLDPTKSISSQDHGTGTYLSNQVVFQQKKKPVKRKKIFWNPLNSGQIKADSLWSNVKGRLQMSQLKYDEKEFADLFTESTDPTDRLRGSSEKTVKAKAKKSVQVIDGKRSMNGGIILARLKLGYGKIAEMVENMNVGKLDSTSLHALKEMLPTVDETKALLSFVENFGSSAEEKQKAYDELSECEKYMYSMISVTKASPKFDCMLFRAQFHSRYEELLDSVEILEKACDEVRSSERLQTVMAMILTLVNQINTGGDGNEAVGFTLDALLKLNEAKAFDKKTSVLHYLVKLIKQNNESLLGLRDDLKHLKDAESIVLDSLSNDIKALKDELVPVLETVKCQAEYLEENGQLVQMSLRELTEQKTSVRTVASVPQYNKIDHHTGRTPMERFTLNAVSKIEEAVLYTAVVKDKFSKVLEYFGEDGNMASNVFFGTMNTFLADFSKAVDFVHKEYISKQKEVAKETKRIRAAALKASCVRIEKIRPTHEESTAGSSHLLPGKSTESTAGLHPSIQQERDQKISQSCDTSKMDLSGTVAKTDGVMIPVEAVVCTSSNELNTVTQQGWLTKVHDAIVTYKLSKVATIDESSDENISDDFEATENVLPKIDRQPEWLVAVQSSIQKYKDRNQ